MGKITKLLKKSIFIFSLSLSLLASGCGQNQGTPEATPTQTPTPTPTPEIIRPGESFLKNGNTNESIVELSKVSPDLWIHTTYQDTREALVPINGLIIVEEEGLILLNPPKTRLQMESLNELVQEAFNGYFQYALSRGLGNETADVIAYFEENKIPIYDYDTVDTSQILLDFELIKPQDYMGTRPSVLWLGKYKLLMAGDWVSSTDSVPNLPGGEEQESWKVFLETLQEKYPDISVIVPDQGTWGDSRLISYTLTLLKQ